MNRKGERNVSNKIGMEAATSNTSARHVLGLSGGKDSAALAIYLKDNYPEIHERTEYFFSDTGAELKEVYDFLDKMEAYLGKEIVRLSSGRTFEHWLKIHNDYLPSPRARWCTIMMKIKPFEQYVGDDDVISYIGIRADENREGYISKKANIKAAFPFVEDGLVRDDVFNILESSVGIPEYYKWRSRSGCYFCFFQQRKEWLGLKQNHPELFEQAAKIEKEAGDGYTWVEGMTLHQLVEKAEKDGLNPIQNKKETTIRWQDQLRKSEEDSSDQSCLICTL